MEEGLEFCGTGRAVPGHILTNEDLCGMVETSDEWIQARTGIRERHICQGETLTDLTVLAARRAMEMAGISADQVGLCIVATITPHCATPSQACLVHEQLGLAQDCPAFDLNAGCTGFLYGLETMAALLPRQRRPYGLLIGGDVLSRVVDWTDRNTCVLFGDGAGAAVLAPSKAPWTCHLHTQGDGNIIWAHGLSLGQSAIHMEGQAVYRFAVETVPKCAMELAQQAQLPLEEVDWFVLHQANRRIVEAAARQMHQPKEKFYLNMQHYGNTSAASIPIALDEMNRAGMLKKGQKILSVGFGAGLTWGGALFTW